MPIESGGEPSRESRGSPAHSSRPLPPLRRIAAWAGVLAAVIAGGVGTLALLRLPADVSSRPGSFEAITVSSAPSAVLPLSEAEIVQLLDRQPQYGPLADPVRRAGCLAGLGYPASTPVLGGRELDIGGRPAVVLLLPGTPRGTVVAVAVAPHCSAADTGLLADTTVRRP